ncbi:uncharacterized protein K02A2.6-like [Uranotaenia lowii]|nr:uncharacterized protein K02A2.6-like [Uranotaenia lowii]XP_055611734.1 uncharacterized protein K02A2.6-like [Uranotaenia lowii]
MANIPVPVPLKLGGDDGEAIKIFRLQWKYYALATEVAKKAANQQVATLMAVMGIEGVMLVEELQLTEEELALPDEILSRIEQHLRPQRDRRMERAEFNAMCQEEEEKIEDFVKRLKKKATSCGYTAAQQEDLLKDRVIAGVRDHQTRKELLKAGDIPVDDMVKKVKEHQQIEELARKYERMSVTKDSARETFKLTATMKFVNKCKYCGGKHPKDKKKCPAFGSKCRACGKLNHYKAVCRANRVRNGPRNKNIRQMEDSSGSAESSDDEEECEYVDIAKVDGEQMKDAGKIMVQLRVVNCTGAPKPLDIQVDTGARVNVLCYRDLMRMSPNAKIFSTKIKLRCYSGKIIAPKGKVNLDVELKDGSKSLTFVIVKKTRPPLLSSQSAIDLGIIKVQDIYNVTALHQSCDGILRKYHDVFEGDGVFHGKFKIEIDDSITAVQQKARRIPLAYLPELKTKIEDLEKRGIVEPVNRHMEWLSNLVLVKKGDKLRLCLDPAELNQAIKRMNHQIPTIEELLPEFAKAKVFTVLDAKNGFWHLDLDERSSDLTAFWTPMGVYRWKRMPFGISCAPEVFQKAQQQIITGLRGVRCLADDVVVFGCGDTMEAAMLDHNRNLEAVFLRCRERGLKLNRAKAKVALSSVPFFGHILTDKGVKPDPGKISAVLDIQPPGNKKELLTFLGLVTYLGRFLPRLSEVSAPLRRLTRDTAEFEWNQEAADCFRLIKRLVTEAPILRYYDPTEPLVIQCDASMLGVGCVLLQLGRPVAYASRTLSKTERNYAPIERECLAIVFACKRFDQYVAGRFAVVESDHKPLEDIFKKPITDAPLRLQKMRMTLQRYDISVRYRKGSEMHIADLLSRTAIPSERTQQSDKVEAAFQEIAEVNVVEFISVSDERFGEIATETRKDRTLYTLLQLLIDGWPENKADLEDEMYVYWAIRYDLSTCQGVIFKSGRVLVPKSLRKKLLDNLHMAHLGIDYTLRAARESFFWPGMTDQITNYVRNCEVCMEFSSNQCKPPMTTHPIPEYPFQRVNIDLGEIKTGNKKLTIMVTADSFSDFVEVDFLSDSKTNTIVKICKRNFARHGSPEVVVTDNGPQFDNVEWREFAREWDFMPVTSSPYHAQGNGKAESSIKAMKQLYKKCVKSGADFWRALQQHRNTPNAVGSSPNQRLFCRTTRSTVPIIANRLKPPKSQDVEESIRHKRAITKMSYDKRAKKLPELQVGAKVLVQRRPDLHSTWEKAVLLRRLEDQSCEVEMSDGAIYRRSAVHVKPGKRNEQTSEVVKPVRQEEAERLHPMCITKESVEQNSEDDRELPNPEKQRVYGTINATGDKTTLPRQDQRFSSSVDQSGSTDEKGFPEIPAERPRREVKKPSRFSDFVM